MGNNDDIQDRLLAVVPGIPTIEFLRLLTDDTRWRILQALRASDMLVGEIAAQTGLAQNLVSYHLTILRQSKLIYIHKSDADARASYYGIDLEKLSQLYQQLGGALALPSVVVPARGTARLVVFLCRANSARSQIAEGWMRTLSDGRITVRSAGIQPTQLHPLATQVMADVGIDIGYQHAKHVDTLKNLHPDAVITVCDIAREECAVWDQASQWLHWSIPDPVTAPPGEQQLMAFRRVRDALRQRVEGLLALLDLLD